MKGIGAGCDEEAIRVIKSMPKWNPGKQNGRPVNVKVFVPIVFKLQ
jgi:protein TonB